MERKQIYKKRRCFAFDIQVCLSFLALKISFSSDRFLDLRRSRSSCCRWCLVIVSLLNKRALRAVSTLSQHLGVGSWSCPQSPGHMDIPSPQTEYSNHCQSGQEQSYSADQSLYGSVVAIQKGLREEKLHPVYVEQLYSEWAWRIIYSLDWHHLEWQEQPQSEVNISSWGGAASSGGPRYFSPLNIGSVCPLIGHLYPASQF